MDRQRSCAPSDVQNRATSAYEGAILSANTVRRRDHAASLAKSEGYDIKYRPSSAERSGRTRLGRESRLNIAVVSVVERMICSCARKIPKYMFVPSISASD
jgi:hypothetical protein